MISLSRRQLDSLWQLLKKAMKAAQFQKKRLEKTFKGAFYHAKIHS